MQFLQKLWHSSIGQTDMKRKCYAAVILLCVFLSFCFSACANSNTEETLNVLFYRQVARETTNKGWCFTFVREGFKDPNADESNLARYRFFGYNIRYRYKGLLDKTMQKSPSENGGLIWGKQSESQARDMYQVEKILNREKTPEELLALDPTDYEFEELDGEMFFRLMREALTGEWNKEGATQLYWDKPEYSFLQEPEFENDYKFQVCFMQETGWADEIFIDVLYKDANPVGYIQLSDLVEDGKANEEQMRLWAKIKEIVNTIKENGVYISGQENFQNISIADIDFGRLYVFLTNVHNNEFDQYWE